MDDAEGARNALRRATSLFEQAGTPHVVYAELEMARVDLMERKWDRAWERCSEVLEQIGAQRHAVLLVHTHSVLAGAAAGAGRWNELQLNLERARDVLARVEVLEPDLAWTLERTGDLAMSAGQRSPARKAWKLALGLYRAMGSDRMDPLQRKLEAARGS